MPVRQVFSALNRLIKKFFLVHVCNVVGKGICITLLGMY